ncbi:MAG: TRAM domain-containing protein [Actinomycetes bacterium]
MSPRLKRVPSAVVELLRLCVVVFFAGVGYYLAGVLSNDTRGPVLGVFSVIGLGIVLGSALGYVLGGVLGRGTVGVVRRTEAGLRETPAEQIVAGAVGAVIGVLVAVGVTWPVFLVNRPVLTIPVFAFVVVALGMLGYRLGTSKRDAVLGMFGARVGLAERPVPAAAFPRILDTSVAIDGRILDVVRSGFLHGKILVPTPVLGELQGLADAGDDQRRGRGRRGLEVLEALRRERGVDVEVLDEDVPAVPEVDAKLVRLCLDRSAALLTLDTNLAKVAALAGVRVMNLHALALALRPPVIAGDDVPVLIIKPGKEPGQGVGYLDDGTMLVVERGRDFVGREVTVTVTSVLTTANGRLVFARLVGADK